MKKSFSLIASVVILAFGLSNVAEAKRMSSRSFSKPRIHRSAPKMAKRQMLPAKPTRQTTHHSTQQKRQAHQSQQTQQDATFQNTQQPPRQDNSNLRSNILSGGAGLAAGYMLGSMTNGTAHAQTPTTEVHPAKTVNHYQEPIEMPELSPEEQLMESLLSIQRNTDALLQAGKITPMQAESIQFYRQKIQQELQSPKVQ